ncbi:MAG: Recombinase [Phycisphaerales bacterium]|nr:Recombinase [Phycisphaerales bacterium]
MSDTKFFIYARKSTDDADRQIRSIEDQLAEVRELAAKHQLNVADVLLEKQSAKKPGRPVFNQMIERIEAGEASGVLAWHPDRLARNMLDGGRIIHMVDTGFIKEMKFCMIDFQPTSQGKFTLAMMFGMSKYYVDNLSENIRRGQRQKVKNGIWPMVAPVGYVNDKKTRMIVPDIERAPLVRKAFELYATGTYTLDRLLQTVNELGLTNGAGTKHKGNPLSRPQYHRLLSNPIYYGTFCYRGEHHEGKHAPIVTKALFDQCQEVLARKSQPKVLDRFKPYLYRGFFRCGECGCFITTETQKGHNYVHCTKRVKRDCSQPYVREERIAEQITEVLSSVARDDEDADWIISQLKADQQKDADAALEGEEKIKADIRETDAKLDRLMVGYLDKLFGPEEYKENKNRLLAEKQNLTEKLATALKNRATRFEPAISFVSELKTAKKLVLEGNLERQRDFLKKVGSNHQIVNRTLRFVPRNAWKTVVDSGRFAQHTTAPAIAGAASVGETDPNHNEAERGRFELPLPFRADRFSKPAHSTTLPPLRGGGRKILQPAAGVNAAGRHRTRVRRARTLPGSTGFVDRPSRLKAVPTMKPSAKGR